MSCIIVPDVFGAEIPSAAERPAAARGGDQERSGRCQGGAAETHRC